MNRRNFITGAVAAGAVTAIGLPVMAKPVGPDVVVLSDELHHYDHASRVLEPHLRHDLRIMRLVCAKLGFGDELILEIKDSCDSEGFTLKVAIVGLGAEMRDLADKPMRGKIGFAWNSFASKNRSLSGDAAFARLYNDCLIKMIVEERADRLREVDAKCIRTLDLLRAEGVVT